VPEIPVESTVKQSIGRSEDGRGCRVNDSGGEGSVSLSVVGKGVEHVI